MTSPQFSLVAQLGGRESNPCGVKNIFLIIPGKTCSSEELAQSFSLSALTA